MRNKDKVQRKKKEERRKRIHDSLKAHPGTHRLHEDIVCVRVSRYYIY